MKKLHQNVEKASSPLRIFLVLLLIISLIEACLMFILPTLLSSTNQYLNNVADAALLAVIAAPFVWFLVARPLRAVALNEQTVAATMLENVVEAVITFDDQGNIRWLNSTAGAMFQCSTEEVIGSDVATLVPGIRLNPARPEEGEVCQAGKVGCRTDGTCFPVDVTISSLSLETESLQIAIVHDITERIQMERLLVDQKEFVEKLVTNNAVPTFVIDPDHRVLLWNRACEELTGLGAGEMLGGDEAWRAFYDHKRPVLADLVIDGCQSATPDLFGFFGTSEFIPEGLQAEGWYKNLNGRDRYIFFNAAPIRNSSGELVAVVETLEDITERKQYEEQLEYQANHDALTGLPNRNLLSDRIDQALLISQRNRQQVAVIFVDLDHFKFINDSLGHDFGDDLLQEFAKRLCCCVRSGDTVARRGGDEFVLVIPELGEGDDARLVADEVRKEVASPFRVKGHELMVTCSMGIAIFPKDGQDVQTLMRKADLAMYKAKEQGRDAFQFFTEEMNARTQERITKEKHLRRALERNELLLHYQPKVSLHSGLVTGMEALIRWQSPELGLVPPGNFIQLAEETGLIEPIGEWVLGTACAQTKAWQDAGFPPLTLAVNLSARQFRQVDLTGAIGKILKKTGLDPRYLELEITESIVMQNVNRVLGILHELKRMGIGLAMDDFGTGYSSLSYLKRFPFDRLKVDQSFVRDITTDPDSAAIATTVIAMAHSLHLTVIAEGVETEGQLDYLRSHGCDEIQGYYFSRPVPAADFTELLSKGRRLDFDQGDISSARSILIVDDEPDVAAALKRVLDQEGYRVLTADSAAEGFAILATNPVSVVLSDLRMPGMDGSEFLRRVKGLYPDTVRLVISGQADLYSVTDAINHGSIYKFLSKPWDDVLLRDTIRQAFRQAG